MPTAIEWTDETWNPTTGCSHVSPGCEACYAETLSLRRGWTQKPWGAQNAAENVVLHPERLDQPFHWKKPRRVFVDSMSDLFHELVPFDFIFEVFRVMAVARDHIYQILTKRPERMKAFVDWYNDHALDGRAAADAPFIAHTIPNVFGHVWLGVSVEDQRRADERIPLLLQTPAAVRFLSCEPLLGRLDFNADGPAQYCLDDVKGVGGPWDNPIESTGPKVDWVIVGGESGPRYRPMDLDWARSLRDQCTAAGVPYFFKQVGGHTPKAGGRLLDGRTWDESPARFTELLDDVRSS